MEKMLAPGQQLWLDLGHLVHDQVPDSDGNTLPPDTMNGSYELRDLDHAAVGQLYEGKLIIDKTYGHAAYGCGSCCGYYDITLIPNPFSGPPGIDNPDVIDATEQCSGFVDDMTDYGYAWSSSNPAVATLPNSTLHTVAAGSAKGSAAIQLLGTHPAPRCPNYTWGPQQPVAVQVPTSLTVQNVSVLTTGTGGNNGCTPSGDYGIEVDVKYQVLDQNSAPINDATMVPHEHVVYTTGQVVDGDICPSRNSNCTHTTASDGTWHDVPYGACGDAPFSLGFAQSITIIWGGRFVPSAY